MRKYRIVMRNKEQIILAETYALGLNKARLNLGYAETAVIFSHTKELFNGIDDLETRCKAVLDTNPIDVVELCTPLQMSNEPPRGSHIEILRVDGYMDSIHFDVGDDDKAKEVYNTLSKYNREVTPLEKFHASF
jgi:hypothetical protein